MSLFEYEFKKRSSNNVVTEDELTSRVFGILEIIGKDFLSKWLKIEEIEKIEYWPRFPGAEPDVVIYSCRNKNVIIECKLEDLGSVEQLKKEYILSKKLNATLLFLTATISKPDIIEKAEKELQIKKKEIHWENWESLYKNIINYYDSKKITKRENNLLVQLKKYLRWMKLGYSLQEAMNKYKEAYDEGWLEIISDKFDRFIKEIRSEFNTNCKSISKYHGICANGITSKILNDKSWINISSSELKKINYKLYYCIIFDSEDYCWEIRLAGGNKSLKQNLKNYMDNLHDFRYNTVDKVTQLQRIAYDTIVSKPDFKDPNSLKKEIIDKSLEFISYIDSTLELRGKNTN